MTIDELKGFVRKNPISVGCGFLSLALIATIYFRSEEIPTANAELEQKSDEAERYAANIKNSAQLKEQYEALVAANKEIDTRIIRANQLGTNTQFFFKIESDTGAKLLDPRQTTQVPVKGKSAYAPVGFTLTAQGDMAQLLSVLHILESGAHYCRVTSATCSLNGVTRSAPLSLSLNLELLGLP